MKNKKGNHKAKGTQFNISKYQKKKYPILQENGYDMTVMRIFVSDTWRTKTNSKTAKARLEESRMLWSCKTQIVYLLPEPWSSEKDEKFFEGKDMKYEKTSKVFNLCKFSDPKSKQEDSA